MHEEEYCSKRGITWLHWSQVETRTSQIPGTVSSRGVGFENNSVENEQNIGRNGRKRLWQKNEIL